MLVLSKEGPCQVFPRSDVNSIQLEIPLGGDPSKNVLKAIYQELVIVCVHQHFPTIHHEMCCKTFSTIILIEHKGLEFVWNY